MLATEHTLDPEALYTINAAGFSATADAFARDPHSQGLWFLSMVGSQTALKAIWASLLKQPPDVAHLIQGADGMALSGSYQRCGIPYGTVGTWTTKIAKLPVSGAGTRWSTPSSPNTHRRTTSSFSWLKRRGKRRTPTTASWTRGAHCRCTPPGQTGCGGGAFRRKRPPSSNRREWSPTAATPTPNPSRRTSPRPSPRGC